MASDALSPAAVHNSATHEAGTGHVHSDSVGDAAQHGARGDAHGGPVLALGGQCVGDLLGTLPAQPCRADVAVGRPGCGPHVPTVGGVPITGGLQMFGDQRSIFISRGRAPGFDNGGQPPVSSARSALSCES